MSGLSSSSRKQRDAWRHMAMRRSCRDRGQTIGAAGASRTGGRRADLCVLIAATRNALINCSLERILENLP